MFVSRLSVEVSFDSTVFENSANMKKKKRLRRVIGCKFKRSEGWVNAIEIRSKGKEVLFSVCPYHKNIVYVTPPSMELAWCV